MGVTDLAVMHNLPQHDQVHTIGGNADVVFRRNPSGLRQNMNWKKILTVHQFDMINNHEKLRQVYNRLLDEWYDVGKGFIAADEDSTCT